MRAGIALALCAATLQIGCGGSESAGGALPPGGASSAAAGGAAPSVMPPAATGAPAAPSASPTGQTPRTQPAAAPSTTPSSSAPAAAPPAATPPAAAAQPPTMPAAGTMTPAATNGAKPKLALDECGLKTKYPGDEYCIKPPPEKDGFQMHIGPSNYDNPEPEYLLQPGDEVTENFSVMSGNKQDVYYYWRQYRMRPGSHHLIVNAAGGGGNFGIGRRLGGSSNMAKDNPEGGVIAPENKGVGMPLAANTMLSNSLHYFNVTDKPIIKEVWVNFWYRPASEVTSPTNEVFSGVSMGIDPGQHVLKHGSCEITEPGRLLTIYGHVHAHNQRFSVWRSRGSEKLLLHEAYDWEHPNVSEFSSTVMNPPTNPGAKVDGGFSGVVDLMAGDTIEFECDILNDTDTTFVGQNEANDDEMCIMVGDSVGTQVSPLCTESVLQPSAN